MKLAGLLIFSILLFICLSVTTFYVQSQSSTRQVGRAACEIYSEASGVRCARITCDFRGYTIPNNNTNDPSAGCTPSHPRDQFQLHCESRGSPICEVTTPISCNADNLGADYGRTCIYEDGTIRFRTIQSPKITCPVICPSCPTPIGTKPCSRAVWSSTYCNWDPSPCNVGGGECLNGRNITGEQIKDSSSSDVCSPCNPSQWELDDCFNSGGTYDWAYCQCGASPIVVDVLGNGFNLTDGVGGVNFDINGDSVMDQISWSAAGSDDAWLTLDRNNNGSIDSGAELFGNSTAQPAPPQGSTKNGFLALAVYDKPSNGGNNDGQITQLDEVFSRLRLWQDLNHNGVSEQNELKTLVQLGLAKIDLDYYESRRADDHGNRFRYRAKIRDSQDAQMGRWAWDVYLIKMPAPQP